MADYYPLIARAVAGLEKSTGEARRAVYERARTALVTQLRGVVPALSEADITRERLSLEEAIRKVEGEAARRPRVDSPKMEAGSTLSPSPPPPPPPPPPLTPTAESSPPVRVTESPSVPQPPPPVREEVARGLSAAPQRKADPPKPESEKNAPVPPRRFSAPGASSPGPQDQRPVERASLVDKSLQDFRNVLAESGELGNAAANASKSARDVFAAFPSREAERVEPSFSADALSPPRDDAARQPRGDPDEPWLAGATSPRSRSAAHEAELLDELPHEPRIRHDFGGIARKLLAGLVVLLLCGLAVFAYRQRDNIAGLFASTRGPAAPQASKDPTQTRPKISDRVGGQKDASGPRPDAGPVAPVAQRVVLYEQQPNSQERKQYVGSVIWRSESSPPGPGSPPDLAIKADVEIPERRLRMSFTIRRNTEQTLPASHTIEILFSTPPDFQRGGVNDVPGILMEEAEQSRGAPLTGLRIKVTEGFFLIGLSAVETDMRRNVQLLRDRSWLHMPILYKDGSRALLAMEKGVPGDRVFTEALTAWQQ